MRGSKSGFQVSLLMFALLAGAMAQTAAAQQAALPYPTVATPAAIDRGALVGPLASTPMSVTLALSLPRLKDAESLLVSLHTQGDPQFHKFLTSDEFVARFAPSAADVARVWPVPATPWPYSGLTS